MTHQTIRSGINSSTLEWFLTSIHESQYVYYESAYDLVFLWNGSLIINVFGTWTLHQVDGFTLGHASGKDVTLLDVQAAIRDYVARLDRDGE